MSPWSRSHGLGLLRVVRTAPPRWDFTPSVLLMDLDHEVAEALEGDFSDLAHLDRNGHQKKASAVAAHIWEVELGPAPPAGKEAP